MVEMKTISDQYLSRRGDDKIDGPAEPAGAEAGGAGAGAGAGFILLRPKHKEPIKMPTKVKSNTPHRIARSTNGVLLPAFTSGVMYKKVKVGARTVKTMIK